MKLSVAQVEAIQDMTGTLRPLEMLVADIEENTDGETPTGEMTRKGVTFPTYTLPCHECGGTATHVAPWNVAITGSKATAECDSCADTH